MLFYFYAWVIGGSWPLDPQPSLFQTHRHTGRTKCPKLCATRALTPHPIQCGTNRLMFPVTGPVSSRISMPHAVPFTIQLPTSMWWPSNTTACGKPEAAEAMISGAPVPVEIDLGDMHPAVVGGLERSDLIDLRPGVAVEQADERRRARRGTDGERAGSGGEALLEAVNGGADGRGLPNPSAWLDADPDKYPPQGQKHQVSPRGTRRD